MGFLMASRMLMLVIMTKLVCIYAQNIFKPERNPCKDIKHNACLLAKAFNVYTPLILPFLYRCPFHSSLQITGAASLNTKQLGLCRDEPYRVVTKPATRNANPE